MERQPIETHVWQDKYRWTDPTGKWEESSIEATNARVVRGVYAKDKAVGAREEALEEMNQNLWVPAGRILAGAGTSKLVTQINCFVLNTILDSMRSEGDEIGIMDSLSNAAFTQQMGGGIGQDFSTIRPRRAIVKRTGSITRGVPPFMDMWDAMCKTIMSSGSRRGAMMATLRCDHPDLPEFITAKHEPGRWTNFNVSVMVTNEFMEAVEHGLDWNLSFDVPRADGKHAGIIQQADGKTIYVYDRIPARKIWEEILKSTYKTAEPGVIFIDRVNETNNLYYCEKISSTNPCFAPGTLVTTRHGARPIEDLVGEEVEIWDGERWVLVDNFRVTGRYQDMVKVELHDGSLINVTLAHRFLLEDGSERLAQDLRLGDRLMGSCQETHGHISVSGAYAKGFFLGDGSESRLGRPWLAIYDVSGKSKCRDRLEASLHELEVGQVKTNAIAELGWYVGGNRTILQGLAPLKEHLLPWIKCREFGLPTEVFQWDRESKIEFLAGLFDADGNVTDGQGFSYHFTATGEKLIRDVQLLLKTLGIRSRIRMYKQPGWKRFPSGAKRWTRGNWRLVLNQPAAVQLARTIKFSRLEDFSNRSPKIIKKSKDTVVSGISRVEIEDQVFCCTVPTTGRFQIGQGIISRNCGEQPLPPNGACNLSAINLAMAVSDPFTDAAQVMLGVISRVTTVGMRFLDNVLDTTLFPLPQQAEESRLKRRTGLGVTGLGNMLQQLRLHYASEEALETTATVMQTIRDSAYWASVFLAKERGPFPLFDKDKFLARPFVKTLPDDLRDAIAEHGIRNGVLLTIAPTGTTSIVAGNVSSGIEPSFSWSYHRKVRKSDGSFDEFCVEDYGYRKYREVTQTEEKDTLPDYMVTALELPVEAHVKMQAVCQQYVDASISKTVNCPEEMSFEDFKGVYDLAWDLGLKGCTTYRPDPTSGRGAVLSTQKQSQQQLVTKLPRPDVLFGMTYKIRWPHTQAAFYVTFNYYVDETGKKLPFEVFVNSKSAQHEEWVTGLTRMISAVFRRGGDVRFVVEELEQVFSPVGGTWIGKRYVPSLVALIGHTLARFLVDIEYLEEGEIIAPTPLPEATDNVTLSVGGEPCPKCSAPTLIHKEGCATCQSCGYSDCG